MEGTTTASARKWGRPGGFLRTTRRQTGLKSAESSGRCGWKALSTAARQHDGYKRGWQRCTDLDLGSNSEFVTERVEPQPQWSELTHGVVMRMQLQEIIQ